MKTELLKKSLLRAVTIAGLLGAIGATAADYATTAKSLNPIGYWRLNEPTQPVVPTYPMANAGSAGATLDGVYYGVPKLGQAGALVSDADTAAQFGAMGQYSEIPYNAALNPATSFTVEFWAKRTNSATATASVLCNFGPGRSNGYLVFAGNADLKWTFRTYNGTTRGSLISTAPIVQDEWTHVVCVHDGTGSGANSIYINGVLDSTLSPAPYAPQTLSSLRLGIGPNNEAVAWPFPGLLDDLAIYPSALSEAQVAAHYGAATATQAPPTPYRTLVHNDGASAYWRLNESALPAYVPYAATNSGSLGSAQDGAYSTLGAVSGAAGGVRGQFAGFESDNRAVSMNGLNGIVFTPALPTLNSANVTMSCWLKRDGSQVGFAGLMFQRDANATGLSFDGANRLSYTWNNAGNTYNFNSGLTVPDGVWTFAALVVTETNAILYMGSTNGLRSATNNVAHLAHDFSTAPFNLGYDNGTRYFKGVLDEALLFDKSLDYAAISNLFYSATPAILQVTRTADPLYEGMTVSLAAYGVGSVPVSYQWRKNGANISGKTTGSLVMNNVSTGSSGNYDVVVTAGGISVTSVVSVITVASGPPIVLQQPVSVTRYEGAAVSFSVSVAGSVPWSFQWKKGGTAITGATAATYSIPAALSGDAGSYTVTITNPYGATTSSAAVLSILPTTGYATAVMRDGPAPVAYWRLNETTGTTAYDYAGGFNASIVGTVGDITNNAAGPVPGGTPSIVGLESTNRAYWYGGTYCDVMTPTLGLNTNTVTISAFVKWEGTMQGDLMWIVNLGGGKGFHVDSTGVLRYHWDGKWDWSSGLVLPAGQWAYVALVVEPSKATLYLDDGNGNGMQTAVHAGTHDNTGFGILSIGSDASNYGWRPFRGEIDEVAVYSRSLSSAEVENQHLMAYSGPTAARIVSQPVSRTVLAGSSVSFTVGALGAVPMTCQWTHAGTNIPGATSKTLTIPSAYYTDAGSYQAVVGNGVGSPASSATATLVVEAPSTYANLTSDLVLHLRFDGNCLDTSGRTNDGAAVDISSGVSYIPGKIGGSGVLVGTNGYVSVASAADLGFGATDSFSVSFWVKCTGANNDVPMLGNAVNSTYQDGWVFSEDGGKIEWTLAGVGDTSSVIADPVPGSPVINDGVWHNVVATFDRGLETAATYVDGIQIDARSLAGLGSLDSSYSLTFGNDPTGGYIWDPVTYGIDDVGIWRRVLTPAQATSIYAAGQIGQSFDVKGPARLTVQRSAGGLELIWPAGTLESADNVEGPYTPVVGAAVPYHKTTIAAGKKFYRVKL